MRVLVINHVSLDGVLQGPGRPDEDTRGGFSAPRLVLGSGQRLFGAYDETHRLRLVDCTPTATGVLIATYQPADNPRIGLPA